MAIEAMNPDHLRAAIEKIGIEKPSDYTLVLEEVGRMEAEEKREIERDIIARLRLVFRKALSDLPEIAPPEIARVLSSVHMRDEFIEEGKRLQRIHGLDAVPPRVEQECGAGAWSMMRSGVLTARTNEAAKFAALLTASEAFIREAEEMGWGTTSDTQLPGSFDSLVAAVRSVRG